MDLVFPPLVKGMIIKRLNRFLAEVEINDKKDLAHVPNSGRMEELIFPGAACWLSKQNKTGRRTAYDLILVEAAGKLIAVDSRLPNQIMENLLKNKRLPDYSRVISWKREAAVEKSRFDFCLTDDKGKIWLEIKSVNLVNDGMAMFPDAPTTRGTRHLHDLINLKQEGVRSELIFIVLRSDASCFTPYTTRDPDFSCALSQAVKEGVKVRAFISDVSSGGITLMNEIPVLINPLTLMMNNLKDLRTRFK